MTRMNYNVFTIGQHTYLLAATERGLSFVGSQDQGVTELKQFYPNVTELTDNISELEVFARQLAEYLSGQRTKFELQTDVNGTEFQKIVWKRLDQIPYGQTTDYSKIAADIGHPNAYRAVGTAVGKNPLLMIVPCHRVLTKSGLLGDYRGGTAMKRELLTLEGSL